MGRVEQTGMSLSPSVYAPGYGVSCGGQAEPRWQGGMLEWYPGGGCPRFPGIAGGFAPLT